jgi:hypothetical protein
MAKPRCRPKRLFCPHCGRALAVVPPYCFHCGGKVNNRTIIRRPLGEYTGEAQGGGAAGAAGNSTNHRVMRAGKEMGG